MRAKRCGGILAAVCLLCASPGLIQAQETPEFDPAVDLQLFEYAVGPKSFMTVADADVQYTGAFNVDFLLTFITDPFTIYNTDAEGTELGSTRTEVVKNLLAGEISGAYGLMDKLHVGAALPLIFTMSGDEVDVTTAMPTGDSLQVSGLGDLRLEAKYKLLEQNALKVAAEGGLTIPTSVGSGGGDFLGDDLPALRARGAAQWSDSSGKMTFGANLGFQVGKSRTIYSSEVGQQIIYGAAGAYTFDDRFSGVAEIFGRGPLTSLDLAGSPLEVVAGARVKATKSISVLAGGGTGLVAGIGSPGLRFFASVGWSPDYRDSDKDGVRNDIDKCVLEAEDRDGFEDDDGCPDPDNDNDKRLDAEDQCPNEREDIDGFEDDDGCPEPDNDKDGKIDIDDRCPNHPEDGAKPYPDDGCPGTKRDSDDDEVSDTFDLCPMDPEDTDGFEDWDGCPDEDNDKDGIPDEDDQCPACAEDKDGDADEDGCPDVGPEVDARLARLEGDVLVTGAPITFDRRHKLDATGAKMAGLVAKVMAKEEVGEWAVVVAMKKAGSTRRSQAAVDKRAAALKAALVAGGVAEDKLKVLATVADADTIKIVARDRVIPDDSGEFVCPAEFVVEPREQPADHGAAASGGSDAPAEPEAPKVLPEAFNSFTGVVEVEFKRNESSLAKGADVLDQVAVLLNSNDFVVAEIGCHTDSRKGQAKSKEITQAQCDAAAKYLTDKGVGPSQIKATGYGMDEPRASNRTSRGRTENRRVEMKFSLKP